MRSRYRAVWLCLSLSLVALLGLAGCAVDQGKVYTKDGQAYGVTSSQVWRGRWWNYYERGSSYAAGEFWLEAIADLQEAIKQRDQDQRRSRTYGCTLSITFRIVRSAWCIIGWDAMPMPSVSLKRPSRVRRQPRLNSISTKRV